MSSSIEIWGFEVTLYKHFSYTDCKAFSEKIVSMIVVSFPEIPPCLRGISKMEDECILWILDEIIQPLAFCGTEILQQL
jgi:hypothetical protein